MYLIKLFLESLRINLQKLVRVNIYKYIFESYCKICILYNIYVTVWSASLKSDSCQFVLFKYMSFNDKISL